MTTNIYNPTYWKANNDLFKSQYLTWSNSLKNAQGQLKQLESELSIYQTLSNDLHLLNKMLPTLQIDKTVTNAFNLTPELFKLLKQATVLQWIKDSTKAVKLTEFQKDNLELTEHLDFSFRQGTIATKANLESRIQQVKASINADQNSISYLECRIEDTLAHFRNIVRTNKHQNGFGSFNVEGFDVKMTLESLIKEYKGDSNE